MAVNIFNTNNHTLLSGTSGNDSIDNGFYDKNGIWHDGGDYVTIDGGAGNDYIDNSSYYVTIDGGTGNDSITNTIYGDYSKINGGAGNDSIKNLGDSVTILGGAGNDAIYNNWNFSSGKAWADSDGSNVLFKYSVGDGNDIIYGFKADSTLSIGGGSYSTTKSGKNIIVTVGTGAVTLVGAANLSKVNIKGTKKTSETNSWKISGTTATYGTSKKTLITVTGLKSGTSASNLSLNTGNKTVTLKAAALSTNKITISDGYKLALGSDVKKSSPSSAKWTKSGTTAKYISAKTTAGYKLSSDAKSISYISASGGSNLITVTGLKNNSSTSGISLNNNKVVTVAANAVADNSKVSVSGSGYKFNITGTSGKNTLIGGKGNDTLKGGAGADLFVYTGGADVITDYVAGTDKISVSGSYTGKVSGKNVILTTDGGTLKILNGANKNLTINGKNKKYGIPSTGTLTLTNSDDTKVTLSSSYKNANASARTERIYITGNSGNNSLVGGSGDDTLNGGTGNDILKGGTGADKFLHSAGNDVITDYTADDEIYLVNTEITAKELFVNDVILTTDNGSITIEEGFDKKIKVIDAHTRKSEIIDYGNLNLSSDNKKLTATADFEGETIDLTEVSFSQSVQTVDASAVINNINIIGNTKNNYLTGGKGSDTIFGSSGDDILTGGAGSDNFLFSEGNDTITDYSSDEDKIYLSADTEITDFKVNANDAFFTTTTGKITVKNGSGKNITVVDSDGEEKIYRKNSVANLAEIVTDNFVGEFEKFEEKVTAENLITFAK